eukprot:112409-Rhodomonas_salina.1
MKPGGGIYADTASSSALKRVGVSQCVCEQVEQPPSANGRREEVDICVLVSLRDPEQRYHGLGALCSRRVDLSGFSNTRMESCRDFALMSSKSS